MRQNILLSALVFGLLASTTALSQEPAKLEFEVKRQPDGTMKVAPKVPAGGEAPTAETGDTKIQETPGAVSTIDMARLLEQLKVQDFWVASGPTGGVSDVYVVPKGVAPPDQMLSGAADGVSFTKLSGDVALAAYFPDSGGMTEVLSSLMTSAKEAVCSMPARPKEFGTVVDVSAGIGVSGRIEFNATWDTVELCK